MDMHKIDTAKVWLSHILLRIHRPTAIGRVFRKSAPTAVSVSKTDKQMVVPFYKRSSLLTTAVATVPIAHLSPRLTRPFRRGVPAVLIPGDSVLETTAIGGTATFFSIYQNVIGKCQSPLRACVS